MSKQKIKKIISTLLLLVFNIILMIAVCIALLWAQVKYSSKNSSTNNMSTDEDKIAEYNTMRAWSNPILLKTRWEMRAATKSTHDQGFKMLEKYVAANTAFENFQKMVVQDQKTNNEIVEIANLRLKMIEELKPLVVAYSVLLDNDKLSKHPDLPAVKENVSKMKGQIEKMELNFALFSILPIPDKP